MSENGNKNKVVTMLVDALIVAAVFIVSYYVGFMIIGIIIGLVFPVGDGPNTGPAAILCLISPLFVSIPLCIFVLDKRRKRRKANSGHYEPEYVLEQSSQRIEQVQEEKTEQVVMDSESDKPRLFCVHCGAKLSENSTRFCPHCGASQESSQPAEDIRVKKEQPEKKGNSKNGFRTAKLIIGIISIVLFIIVAFQSCAIGLSNSLLDNGESSGFAGFLVAFLMLISGIVGVSTRDSKGGGITAGVFYAFAGLIGLGNFGSFKDLELWSYLCLIFASVFIVGSLRMKKPSEKE